MDRDAAVPAAVVERFASIAREFGHTEPIPITVTRYRQPRASMTKPPFRPRLHLSRGMLETLPVEHLDAVLAHELGHRQVSYYWRDPLVGLAAMMSTVGAAMLLQGTFWATSTAAALVPFALSVLVMAWAPFVMRRSRLIEKRCDDLAAEHGYPMTPAAAQWFEVNVPHKCRRWTHWACTHPRWDERWAR